MGARTSNLSDLTRGVRAVLTCLGWMTGMGALSATIMDSRLLNLAGSAVAGAVVGAFIGFLITFLVSPLVFLKPWMKVNGVVYLPAAVVTAGVSLCDWGMPVSGATACVVSVFLMAMTAYLCLPDDLGRPPWMCPGCGYDLRGIPGGGVCPECGNSNRPARPERKRV